MSRPSHPKSPFSYKIEDNERISKVLTALFRTGLIPHQKILWLIDASRSQEERKDYYTQLQTEYPQYKLPTLDNIYTFFSCSYPNLCSLHLYFDSTIIDANTIEQLNQVAQEHTISVQVQILKPEQIEDITKSKKSKGTWSYAGDLLESLGQLGKIKTNQEAEKLASQVAARINDTNMLTTCEKSLAALFLITKKVAVSLEHRAMIVQSKTQATRSVDNSTSITTSSDQKRQADPQDDPYTAEMDHPPTPCKKTRVEINKVESPVDKAKAQKISESFATKSSTPSSEKTHDTVNVSTITTTSTAAKPPTAFQTIPRGSATVPFSSTTLAMEKMLDNMACNIITDIEKIKSLQNLEEYKKTDLSYKYFLELAIAPPASHDKITKALTAKQDDLAKSATTTSTSTKPSSALQITPMSIAFATSINNTKSATTTKGNYQTSDSAHSSMDIPIPPEIETAINNTKTDKELNNYLLNDPVYNNFVRSNPPTKLTGLATIIRIKHRELTKLTTTTTSTSAKPPATLQITTGNIASSTATDNTKITAKGNHLEDTLGQIITAIGNTQNSAQLDDYLGTDSIYRWFNNSIAIQEFRTKIVETIKNKREMFKLLAALPEAMKGITNVEALENYITTHQQLLSSMPDSFSAETTKILESKYQELKKSTLPPDQLEQSNLKNMCQQIENIRSQIALETYVSTNRECHQFLAKEQYFEELKKFIILKMLKVNHPIISTEEVMFTLKEGYIFYRMLPEHIKNLPHVIAYATKLLDSSGPVIGSLLTWSAGQPNGNLQAKLLIMEHITCYILGEAKRQHEATTTVATSSAGVFSRSHLPVQTNSNSSSVTPLPGFEKK